MIVELVGQQFALGKSPRGQMKFRVSGADTAVLAYALVNAASPAMSAGMVKETVDVEELGGGHWDGIVQYGILERSEGSVSWDFEIGTANLKITQALEHVATYGATDCDHRGAIGVRKDGNGQTLDGTDIYIPVFTWSETHCLPYSLVTDQAWLALCEATVAKINDAPFRVWDTGELLMLGISGAKRGEEPVPVTFRFASSRTKRNITVGSGDDKIEAIDKEGWHYLWIEYQQKDNSTELVSRPKAVHVERVYDYAEFTALGLPDPWH